MHKTSWCNFFQCTGSQVATTQKPMESQEMEGTATLVLVCAWIVSFICCLWPYRATSQNMTQWTGLQSWEELSISTKHKLYKLTMVRHDTRTTHSDTTLTQSCSIMLPTFTVFDTRAFCMCRCFLDWLEVSVFILWCTVYQLEARHVQIQTHNSRVSLTNQHIPTTMWLHCFSFLIVTGNQAM